MLYSFKWNVIEYGKLGEKICSSSPGPEDHVKYCELCHHFLSSMIISGNSAIISWHLLVWSPGVQTLVSGYIGFQSFGVQTMVSESRVHTSLVSGLTSSKGRITNIGIRPFRVYELQSLELKHLFQDLCVPRLWCNIWSQGLWIAWPWVHIDLSVYEFQALGSKGLYNCNWGKLKI